MVARAQHQAPLVVVGSVNADLVLQVERLPKDGETLGAQSLDTFPGGKVSAYGCRCGAASLYVSMLCMQTINHPRMGRKTGSHTWPYMHATSTNPRTGSGGIAHRVTQDATHAVGR